MGSSILNSQDGTFHFNPGPIFANILVADEINRASPRTQSALLEAMGEQQVTVDGQTHSLELPFLCIATQNPVEFHGTYPLPEAQLDRFSVRLTLGYVYGGRGATNPRRLSKRDIRWTTSTGGGRRRKFLLCNARSSGW